MIIVIPPRIIIIDLQESLALLSLLFLVSFCYFIIHRAQSCEPILKDEQFLWSADNFVWTWQMLPFASASCIQL